MRRSKFSLSNYKLFSCNMGLLYPIGLTEVLPGDTIQQATSALVRASALLAPVMHPVHVRIHHWFVPHRLVWDNWESFITSGPGGDDVNTIPQKALSAVSSNVEGALPDYYGIKPGIDVTVSALPFRGYSLIWNEWYRDNFITEQTTDRSNGPDVTTDMEIRRIAWEKDYFTVARPYEQLGPDIGIPVTSNEEVPLFDTGTGGSGDTFTDQQLRYLGSASRADVLAGTLNRTGDRPLVYGSQSGLEITPRALREALGLQRYAEARARYGSRYVEYLRYLGVRSSDARLQRPEYLGGGKQTIQFSEVLQTAEGTNPVGELRGHGIAAMRSNRYRRFFEEHGYIHTLFSVRPKTIYNDALARHWLKLNREDFWQKELERIGQQIITNKEIMPNHASPSGTFAYADRYDEYRRGLSSIASEFRSVLDFWHFARAFGSDPAFNQTFIECLPTDNPFAVPSQDLLYVMANHSIQARRLVSRNATPAIM